MLRETITHTQPMSLDVHLGGDLFVGSHGTSMSEAVARVQGGVQLQQVQHNRDSIGQHGLCDCDQVVILQKGENRLIRTGNV